MLSESQDKQQTDAMIDDVIRDGMAKAVKKSERFAARLSMTQDKSKV